MKSDSRKQNLKSLHHFKYKVLEYRAKTTSKLHCAKTFGADILYVYVCHLPVLVAMVSAMSFTFLMSSLGLEVVGMPPCLRWFLCCFRAYGTEKKEKRNREGEKKEGKE
jgi:hypothetical protein